MSLTNTEIGTDGSFGVGIAYLHIFAKSQVYLLETVGFGGSGTEHSAFILSVQPTCTPKATLAAKVKAIAENQSQ